MNTLKYVLDKLSRHDEQLNMLRSVTLKHKKINTLVAVYLIANTALIFCNEIEKQQLRNEIDMLKKEVNKVKGE